MVDETGTNSWVEWSRYILEELKHLNQSYDRLDERLRHIEQQTAMLNVKSGVWGMLGGILAFLAVLAVSVVKELL